MAVNAPWYRRAVMPPFLSGRQFVCKPQRIPPCPGVRSTLTPSHLISLLARSSKGGTVAVAQRSSSLARLLRWTIVGPFVALGGLMLLVFSFAALAVVARLLAAFLT